MIIILFGVCGCGKTAVGKELAQLLGWEFIDGDIYHSKENIKKMKVGFPLTDQDRLPWLKKLAQTEREKIKAGQNLILACSALKKRYREILNVDKQKCFFVYLKGEEKLIRKRLQARKGHFMPPTLLQSQFETLEEPQEHVLIISIEKSIKEIVKEIRFQLQI